MVVAVVVQEPAASSFVAAAVVAEAVVVAAASSFVAAVGEELAFVAAVEEPAFVAADRTDQPSGAAVAVFVPVAVVGELASVAVAAAVGEEAFAVASAAVAASAAVEAPSVPAAAAAASLHQRQVEEPASCPVAAVPRQASVLWLLVATEYQHRVAAAGSWWTAQGQAVVVACLGPARP